MYRNPPDVIAIMTVPKVSSWEARVPPIIVPITAINKIIVMINYNDNNND